MISVWSCKYKHAKGACALAWALTSVPVCVKYQVSAATVSWMHAYMHTTGMYQPRCEVGRGRRRAATARASHAASNAAPQTSWPISTDDFGSSAQMVSAYWHRHHQHRHLGSSARTVCSRLNASAQSSAEPFGFRRSSKHIWLSTLFAGHTLRCCRSRKNSVVSP